MRCFWRRRSQRRSASIRSTREPAAENGEEVANKVIVKGNKVDTDSYLEITKDELANIALDSTRTIDIDQFVPRIEIDGLYIVRPYYLVPDSKAGHDAYAVIRDTIKATARRASPKPETDRSTEGTKWRSKKNSAKKRRKAS